MAEVKTATDIQELEDFLREQDAMTISKKLSLCTCVASRDSAELKRRLSLLKVSKANDLAMFKDRGYRADLPEMAR
jgi:hypothetical protein